MYYRLLSILVFSFLLVPKPSHAAACCTSATAFGTGRLLLWESWAAGIRTSSVHEFGFYDDYGHYENSQQGEVDRQLRIEAYSLVSITKDASIFVVIPWLFPTTSTRSGSLRTGSNISDIQIGYRHQIIDIGEYEELPSLALSLSLLVPTGTPRAKDVSPYDVTGRGVLGINTGASLEKTWHPFFLQLNLGGSLLINNIRGADTDSDSVSPSFQIALASGIEFTEGLVMSILGQFSYEVPQKYKSTLGASLSWRFDPHITALLNVNTDPFLDGLGANWPGQFSYGFGLRYGYF